jgi:hypothetical protein
MFGVNNTPTTSQNSGVAFSTQLPPPAVIVNKPKPKIGVQSIASPNLSVQTTNPVFRSATPTAVAGAPSTNSVSGHAGGLGKGSLVDRKKLNFGKVLDGVNATDIANLTQLGISNFYNNQATKQYIRAVKESYSPNTIMPTTHLKMPSTFNPLVEKEASNYTQMGRRVAGATSDLNQGLSARLQSENNASDIRLKGALAAQEEINKIVGAQQEMDYKTKVYNMGVVDANRAKYADMNSKISQIYGQKTAITGNIMNNFLTTQAANMQTKREKAEQIEGSKQYFEYLKDPAYSNAVKLHNEQYSEAAMLQRKDDFEKSQQGNTTPAI